MAEVSGVIKHIEQDRVAVQLQRQSGCSKCERSGHCSLNWSDSRQEKLTYIPLEDFTGNAIQLQVGESIQLECEDRSLLRLIMSVFLPAIAMLLVAGLLDLRLSQTRLGQDSMTTFLLQATLYVGALSIALLVSRFTIGMAQWKAPVPVSKKRN